MILTELKARDSQVISMIVACIPCLDEEKNIARVLIKTQKHVDKVIVCDDGSSDLTGEIAEKLGAIVLKHKTNLGKGYSIKDLFDRAIKIGADVVVTLDGDGQHNPDEIPKVVAPILRNDSDVVNGSRMHKEDQIPRLRRIGNRILNVSANLGASSKISDTQSGFRAYSKDAIDKMEITDHGIGVDSQILMSALAKNLKVIEVPIGVTYDEDSSSYNPFRHGLYVFLTIIRTVTQRSPLLYLGVPGLIILLSSIPFSISLLNHYTATEYFSVPLAILMIGAFLIGLVLIIGAMILFAITNIAMRRRSE